MKHRGWIGAGLLGVVAITVMVVLRRQRPADDEPGIPSLTAVERLGALTDELLTEASALTPSRRVAGLYWSLNDSGHESMLFAVGADGAARGRVPLSGAANRDWEALASGPCPAGDCLYVGDIGDNDGKRAEVQVYRVLEPTLESSPPVAAEQLRVRYPDGPADAEAMWVAPDTSVWIITKRPRRDTSGQWTPVRVYRVPPSAWSGAQPVVAVFEGTLPIVPRPREPWTWTTDAALSPPDSAGDRRLAVRTYERVHVFDVNARTGKPGALRRTCALAVLDEAQGEGVAWRDARTLVLASEERGTPLWSARCE
jgi:hypothetical protein